MRPKDVLTTGDVARICNVAPRTVSKWFDTGKLRGYRIPGSKDRRIPLDQLVRFMRAHDIPLNGLESGTTRVLIVESDANVGKLLADALSREAGFETVTARHAFEAGYTAASSKPRVILMDVDISGLSERDALQAIRNLPEMNGTRFVAISSASDTGTRERHTQDGFDAVLSRPIEVPTVVRTIESLIQAQG